MERRSLKGRSSQRGMEPKEKVLALAPHTPHIWVRSTLGVAICELNDNTSTRMVVRGFTIGLLLWSQVAYATICSTNTCMGVQCKGKTGHIDSFIEPGSVHENITQSMARAAGAV